MSAELYDVVIYNGDSRKITAVIGTNLPAWDGDGHARNTADLRVQSGRSRISEDYECDMVPAGQFKEGDILP